MDDKQASTKDIGITITDAMEDPEMVERLEKAGYTVVIVAPIAEYGGNIARAIDSLNALRPMPFLHENHGPKNKKKWPTDKAHKGLHGKHPTKGVGHNKRHLR